MLNRLFERVSKRFPKFVMVREFPGTRRQFVRRHCCIAILLFSPAALAQSGQGPVRIDLEQAVQLALEHNHSLQGARSLVRENQAQEITANLRPNPVLAWDAQFLPIFEPHQFSADYVNNSAQFDFGIGYLFERGGKRQHRLQAARDQTAIARFVVADNERSLVFGVAAQYISVLLAESTLEFAQQNLTSFEKVLEISAARFKAGDISEADNLKLKLQLLQFQTDVSAAQLAKVQALGALRQLLGYQSVPADYDVAEQLDYRPLATALDDLLARALRERPDLRAAQQGITAAQSQFTLAEANRKRDLTASFNYTHQNALHLGATFFNIQLPIFDRNQGEIARTRAAVTRFQEVARAGSEQVVTDVRAAYESVRANDRVVLLYRSGYLDQARKSLEISEFAYRRGAVSLLDFLDAQRSYRSSQLSYRQVLAAYMASVEQLKQVVGTRTLAPQP